MDERCFPDGADVRTHTQDPQCIPIDDVTAAATLESR
jgi:hypothetical protein